VHLDEPPFVGKESTANNIVSIYSKSYEAYYLFTNEIDLARSPWDIICVVFTRRIMCSIAYLADGIVRRQALPAELVATLQTCHMIAAIILLNVVSTAFARTSLSGIEDQSKGSHCLFLLSFALFGDIDSVIVLLACLSAMPFTFVMRASLKAA